LKRILITGASGFIGRHVIAPLRDRGFEVHAVGSKRPMAEGAETHAVDLMDLTAITELLHRVRPTHLLHLAWYAEPGKFWTAPQNLDWTAATLQLYRAFVESGGQRFIGAGTCAEYDWSHAELDERQTPCAPATLYGIAKDSVRRILESAAAIDRLSFAWGRIFFLYGPHEKPGRLVSDVIASLLRGKPVETSEGTQRRDFMHVQDVADAFAALCDCAVTGPVNIASGIDRPLRDMLKELADLTGGQDLLRLGARPMAANDPPRLAATVRRLHAEVGFTPRYDLHSGLKDTVAWWRNNQ
jgi:nucleoside-diphosphate-sugar epimerase